MRNYEHCIECEERTGRAGASDDSLYHGYSGPFCEDCFDAWPDNQVSQIIILRQELKQAQARVAEPVAFAVYWGNGEVELHEAPMPALGGDPEAVTPLYTRPPKGQAVPVGEIVTKPFVDVKFFENTEFGTALPEGTKLYTHPQPAHQGSVPDGWKLVPVEPTGDMEEAGCQGYMEADGNWVMHRSSMGFAYKAMLDAAPQPPQEGE